MFETVRQGEPTVTLHIKYNHQCPRCEAYYIPYDDDVPCPRCGLLEGERFDFIPQAVESMLFNKAEGSYTPAAWWVGSLADHILRLLFPLFDAFDEEKPEDFRAFATEWFDQMEWGDQQYLKNHVLGIAVRIHEVLYQEGK